MQTQIPYIKTGMLRMQPKGSTEVASLVGVSDDVIHELVVVVVAHQELVPISPALTGMFALRADLLTLVLRVDPAHVLTQLHPALEQLLAPDPALGPLLCPLWACFGELGPLPAIPHIGGTVGVAVRPGRGCHWHDGCPNVWCTRSTGCTQWVARDNTGCRWAGLRCSVRRR